MVQSTAASVDGFMEEVAPERRPALDRLRGLCLERFGADTELIAFGMPAYGPPKQPWIAFNSQKQHIAFYVGESAMEAFPERLKGIDHGKGCVRWRKAEAMDFDLIADMLDHVKARTQGG